MDGTLTARWIRNVNIARARIQMEMLGDDLSLGRGVLLLIQLAEGAVNLARIVSHRRDVDPRALRVSYRRLAGYMEQLEAWVSNYERGEIDIAISRERREER